MKGNAEYFINGTYFERITRVMVTEILFERTTSIKPPYHDGMWFTVQLWLKNLWTNQMTFKLLWKEMGQSNKGIQLILQTTHKFRIQLTGHDNHTEAYIRPIRRL